MVLFNGLYMGWRHKVVFGEIHASHFCMSSSTWSQKNLVRFPIAVMKQPPSHFLRSVATPKFLLSGADVSALIWGFRYFMSHLSIPFSFTKIASWFAVICMCFLKIFPVRNFLSPFALLFDLYISSLVLLPMEGMLEILCLWMSTVFFYLICKTRDHSVSTDNFSNVDLWLLLQNTIVIPYTCICIHTYTHICVYVCIDRCIDR